MDFVAFCFHLESCSVKVCLNWRRKVNWTFWYQMWVDRGWLWKKLPPKARSAWMPVQTIVYSTTVLYYSLNGHPSRPENWPFFQHSHVCTWQCRTLKCSATHLAFSPVSRLFLVFCCAQWAKIRSSRSTADKNGGHWHWQFELQIGSTDWSINCREVGLTWRVFWNVSEVTCSRCAVT